MKNRVMTTLFAGFLAGCSTTQHGNRTGGPYYYKHAITKQGYHPNEEITKTEAENLARNGYAYYIAYFNPSGKPNRLLKVYKEKTVFDQEIKYDANGHEIGTFPNQTENIEQ